MNNSKTIETWKQGHCPSQNGLKSILPQALVLETGESKQWTVFHVTGLLESSLVVQLKLQPAAVNHWVQREG